MTKGAGKEMWDKTTDKIPATEMLQLYRLVRAMEQADRLEMARWLSRTPHVLASMFGRSVLAFTRYDNTEPFHGPRKTSLGPPPRTITTGHHAQQHLWAAPDRQWSVEDARDHGFRVLDYEVKVTRTTRSPGFTDATPPRAGLTTDLLLRGTNGQAIVCEIKVGTETRDDEEPFLALIQALASAAHLATTSQRARLDHYYDLRSADQPIDVYVLMVKPAEPRPSRHQDKLDEAARRIARGVLELPGVAPHVGRIAFVEGRLAEDSLILRLRDEATTAAA